MLEDFTFGAAPLCGMSRIDEFGEYHSPSIAFATGAWPTITDITTRQVMGKSVFIAEMMSQSNDYFDDAVWIEANEAGGHETVFRTSIPAGSWRLANQGVPYGKSTTAKMRVGIASLEDYSQVDRWIAEQAGDIDEFRESEDIAFLEGMSQTFVQTAFYGNTAINPAEFFGWAPFYNTVATGTAQNAANVFDGGGKGSNNMSIWFLCHGEHTLVHAFPRGSKAGLAMEDKADTVPGFDSLGNRFEAYTSWFRQQGCIVPMDWRYGARIANIDVTAAGLAGPNALDLFATLAEVEQFFPHLTAKSSGITKTDAPRDPAPGIRPVVYLNRTGRHWMDVQAMRDRNVLLRAEDYDGVACLQWRGIPIKVVDQLINTESRVT